MCATEAAASLSPPEPDNLATSMKNWHPRPECATPLKYPLAMCRIAFREVAGLRLDLPKLRREADGLFTLAAQAVRMPGVLRSTGSAVRTQVVYGIGCLGALRHGGHRLRSGHAMVASCCAPQRPTD